MKKYINVQKFNDGIAVQGQVPIDDRLVFTDWSDLYISDATKNSAKLYALAYVGMPVAIVESGVATIAVLRDDTPYTPGKTDGVLVNAQNFENYWTIIGKSNSDYISGVLDPSVNSLHSYINTTNISNKNAAGACIVTVNSNANGVGKTYQLNVNVDDDTIKIVTNKVTGTKYKFSVADTTNGYLKSYKLQAFLPGASDWTDVDGSLIDIPKDNILKDVHICKATTSVSDGNTVYTETKKSGEDGWDEAQGDVYIHFIWATEDLTDGEKTTDSFLKVSEIIDVDLTGVRDDIDDLNEHCDVIDSSIVRIDESLDSSVARIDSSIARIDSSIARIDSSLNRIDLSLDSSVRRIDSSIARIDSSIVRIDSSLNRIDLSLDSSVRRIDSSIVRIDASLNRIDSRCDVEDTSINSLDSSMNQIYEAFAEDSSVVAAALTNINGRLNVLDSSINNDYIHFNTTLGDDMEVLTKHGNLAAHTKVSELKAMTISQLLEKILFEVAEPHKIPNGDAKATISWKSGNKFASTVEVGTSFPTNEAFDNTYTSERWQWKSADGTQSGPVVNINTKGGVTIYKTTTSTNAGASGSQTWTGNVAEGGGEVNGYWYVGIVQNPGDNAKDSLGYDTKNNDGVTFYKKPNIGTIYSDTITCYGGWYVYSNASKISSSSLYDIRNINPGAYSSTIKKASFFAHSVDDKDTNRYKEFYVQWPGGTTDSEYFYVCVPSTHSITSASGAHPNDGTFSISLTVTQDGTYPVTSGANASVTNNYKKYKISKQGGITTAKIVLS